MRHARIIAAVAGTPWAIEPVKGRAIADVLAFAAGGGRRSADQIEALIGRPSWRAYDDDETAEQRRARLAAQEEKAIQDRGGVAIVALKGVISPRLSDEMDVSSGGGTSAEGFAKRLRAAVSDPRIGGIVIDVDSPGGNVLGVQEATDALYAARGSGKPIVAVASPHALSAAYWIAASASQLAVTPSGEVGSIGVYGIHEDLSKAMEAAGVTVTVIAAEVSPNKAEGHPAFPLSDEARAARQAAADRYGRAFVSAVSRGRGVPPEDVVASFGGGRIVGAEDALAAGMVDRIATLDDEIARMAETLSRPASRKSRAEAMRRRAALW
jgi:signal peptide peptidase SppA